MMDLEMIACFCDESDDLLLKWEQIVLKMEKDRATSVFDELFRIAHNLKGCSRSVGLEQFGNFIHRVEDGITLLKTGSSVVNPQVLQGFYQVQVILSDWLKNLRINPEYEPPNWAGFIKDEYAPAFHPTEAATVAATQEIPQSPVSEQVSPSQEVKPSMKVLPENTQSPKNADEKKPTLPPSVDETIRVSAKKLEQMMQLVGELSIHQSVILHSKEVIENKNLLLSRASYDANKLLRELYDRTISLRMHPIQPIFQRLERSIREIARTLGKEVEVVLEGSEVELDKTVCDRLLDPLVHMVRNSVDHGIEFPDQREQAGKPKMGTVKIRAVNESGGISLYIEDDGKGLSKTKILEKAKKQGIVQDGTQLSPSETFALIFLPGFSTAEKVTDISGRGVGLDVVMKTIESLQGRVNIMSEEGKGTRFSISLPTTLSLIDALVVEYGGNQYAVPVSMVEEILDLSALGIDSSRSVINLRNEVIPMQSLRRYLTSSKRQDEMEVHHALVAKVGKTKVGFYVERILGQQQILIRPLAPSMENVFGFCGSTILGSGEPGLIIDLSQIAIRYFRSLQSNLEEKVA